MQARPRCTSPTPLSLPVGPMSAGPARQANPQREAVRARLPAAKCAAIGYRAMCKRHAQPTHRRPSPPQMLLRIPSIHGSAQQTHAHARTHACTHSTHCRSLPCVVGAHLALQQQRATVLLSRSHAPASSRRLPIPAISLHHIHTRHHIAASDLRHWLRPPPLGNIPHSAARLPVPPVDLSGIMDGKRALIRSPLSKLVSPVPLLVVPREEQAYDHGTAGVSGPHP